jgi:hypothetical protein
MAVVGPSLFGSEGDVDVMAEIRNSISSVIEICPPSWPFKLTYNSPVGPSISGHSLTRASSKNKTVAI